jgi:hypothetical protein
MKSTMTGLTELTASVGYTWRGNDVDGKAIEARLDGIWVNQAGNDKFAGSKPQTEGTAYPSAPFKHILPHYTDPFTQEQRRLSDHAAVGVEVGMRRTKPSRISNLRYTALPRTVTDPRHELHRQMIAGVRHRWQAVDDPTLRTATIWGNVISTATVLQTPSPLRLPNAQIHRMYKYCIILQHS